MKLFVLKRKILTVALCAVAAAAMFGAVNGPAVVGAAATTRQLPIYCVQRDQKMISISFDAAWGNASVRSLGPKAPASAHSMDGDRNGKRVPNHRPDSP